MVSRNNYIEENPGISDKTLLQNCFYFLSSIVAYGWRPTPPLYPMGRARGLKHVSENDPSCGARTTIAWPG